MQRCVAQLTWRSVARTLTAVGDKISVLMHTASKTFTKGSAAANGALAHLMNALRIAIQYEDITKESHVTKEFLTGAKASTGPHAEEVFVCIFTPRWRGPRATWGRWSQKYRNIAQVQSPLHSQRFASSVEANNTTSLESAQQQRL